MTTVRPSATSRLPTLPMVVVLPTPLTPTNSHTLGSPGSKSQRAVGRRARRAFELGLQRVERAASGSVMPVAFTRCRGARRAARWSAPTPTSARMQRLLELVPGLVVDAVRRADRAECRPARPGLAEPIAEARGVRALQLGDLLEFFEVFGFVDFGLCEDPEPPPPARALRAAALDRLGRRPGPLEAEAPAHDGGRRRRRRARRARRRSRGSRRTWRSPTYLGAAFRFASVGSGRFAPQSVLRAPGGALRRPI